MPALVAIKILPAAFSADSDRLHRFEQEARSASALNHPNIIAIHAFGKDGSAHYIAMELAEGKTLRELLVSGLLPIRKAIEIAAQVAGGRVAAHRRPPRNDSLYRRNRRKSTLAKHFAR